MKDLIKNLARGLGLDVRRLPRVSCPYVKRYTFGSRSFDFWISTDTAEDWYAGIAADDIEARLLGELVPQSGALVEVGAHHFFHGMFLAAGMGPEQRLVGIEAAPDNALIAQAQIGLNGFGDRVRLINCIAGVGGGEKAFSLSDNKVQLADGQDQVTVPVRSVDEICAEFAEIGLVKIDVEGYEWQVIASAKETLARCQTLALEVHYELLRHFGEDIGELQAWINDMGFVGTALTEDRVEPYAPELLTRLAPNELRTNLFLRKP